METWKELKVNNMTSVRLWKLRILKWIIGRKEAKRDLLGRLLKLFRDGEVCTTTDTIDVLVIRRQLGG